MSELPNPYLDEMEETVQLLFKELIEKSKRRMKKKQKQKQH